MVTTELGEAEFGACPGRRVTNQNHLKAPRPRSIHVWGHLTLKPLGRASHATHMVGAGPPSLMRSNLSERGRSPLKVE